MALRVSRVAGRRLVFCIALSAGTSMWGGGGITASQTAAKVEPDKPSSSWKRLASTHFVAVGDATENEIAGALKELEVFRFAISGLLPDVRFSSPPPTMVVFKGDNAFYPFKPRDSNGRIRDNVAGYYLNRPEGSVMVLAVHPAQRVERFSVVLHEYAHDVIQLNLPRVPTWLNEGIAEFYSSIAGVASYSGRVQGDDGRVLGRPLNSRLAALRGPLLPLQDLIVPDRAAEVLQNPRQIGLFYAQSWALVHYLLIGRPGRQPGQLGGYIEALAKGESAIDAFTQVFGTTLDAMNRELIAYVGRRTWQAIPLRVPPEIDQVAIARAEPLLESEAETIQAQLLLGFSQTDEADRRLVRALARNPTLPSARLAMALVHLDNHRPNDARAMLAPLIAQLPTDFAAHWYFGQASLHSTRYQEALDAFSRAVAAKPDDALGWYGLSVAAAAVNDAGRARNAMDKVQQISPGANWYFMRARAFWDLGLDAAVIDDVRAYVQGQHTDGFSAYAPFIGILSARRLAHTADAEAFLAAAERGAAPDTWTSTVLSFLRGTLSANQFLSKAKSNGEQTEVHAYVGVMAALSGQTEQALLHLRWVKERGARNYTEYPMALAELARIEKK